MNSSIQYESLRRRNKLDITRAPRKGYTRLPKEAYESESAYDALIENMQIGACRMSLDGLVHWANPHFARLFGFGSSGEMVKAGFRLQHVRLTDENRFEDALRKSGAIYNFETQSVFRKGETISLILGAFLSGGIVWVLALDTTGQRKIAAEIKEQSLRIHELQTALKVVLDHKDTARRNAEERIVDNVKNLVLPYIEDMKGTRLSPRQGILVETIQEKLKEIISPFLENMCRKYPNFTPSEIKVADFIKDGKTAKEIAAMLGVSEAAVNLHRQNVRKKLGLTSAKVSLRTYLMSLTK